MMPRKSQPKNVDWYLDMTTRSWQPVSKMLPFTLFNSVQSSPVQSSPVQSSPVQSSPVQSSPVQSSPVQSSPVQFSPVQFNTDIWMRQLINYHIGAHDEQKFTWWKKLRWGNQHKNRVFNLALKLFNESSGSRRCTGSAFQAADEAK